MIAERFNGPPGSGNGGYVCGTLAALVSTGPVAVRLLRPPRLGVPHAVDGGRLLDGDAVVAEAAVCADDQPELPPPVLLADAEAASQRFVGYLRHPFPTCFGCGTDRPDGLRIFAGPVAGTTSVAAPWRPEPTLAVAGQIPAPILWTALDCPGGWAIMGSAVAVLGTMLGQILRSVSPGDELVVTAAPSGTQGRKRYAVSAVRTTTGELVAWSRQTWIEVN